MITGGSLAKKASWERIIAWFEHHMRCVLMTAFGVPVEPDVNRNLTTESDETLAWAAAQAEVGGAESSVANKLVGRPGIGLRATTISASGGTTDSMARRNGWPSATNTRPGVSSSMMERSLLKSLESSE